MSSALTGSTTEPVITNRITRVEPQSSASASGSESSSELSWSMNAAVPPPTRKGNGASLARMSSDELLRLLGRGESSAVTTSIRQTPSACCGGGTVPGESARQRRTAAASSVSAAT